MSLGGAKQDKVKETPEMRELAKISASKWNIAQEFEPLMDEYMSRIDALGSESAEDYVQGKANLSTQNAFGQVKKSANNGLMLSGIDPSSGRSAGLNTGITTSAGSSGATSMLDAGFEKDTQALAGEQNILDISLGKSGQAQAGLSDIATLANNEAISKANNAFNEKAANAFNEKAANAQAFGTVTGMGAAGLKDYFSKPSTNGQGG